MYDLVKSDKSCLQLMKIEYLRMHLLTLRYIY